MNKPIYLDYNATTPVDPAVARAMQPYLENTFGNPSSVHAFGMEARKAVERAREQVAALLHCHPDEVVFTSGGTESNNLALKGAAFELRARGDHIITTVVEHPAVSEVCRFLETQGFRLTWLEVDSTGSINPSALRSAITPRTILISVMHANNEVGTIQPVEEVGRLAREHGILFHTDAAQSAAKIPIEVERIGAGLLSVAGHKMYAPKGVGALYIRRGVKLQKLMHGAGHERDMRAGTENVPEIVGLGHAAEMALSGLPHHRRDMQRSRDRLFTLLKESVPGIRLNGHLDLSLPNTLSLGFVGLEANALLDELEGIAASAGAACHAGEETTSAVLSAMGVTDQIARGTIRFSTGRFNTLQEMEQAAALIAAAAKRLSGQEETTVENADGPIRLTRYTHGLGCACKVRPQYLADILKDLPLPSDPNVLVGTVNSDDAAVYRISDEMALVQSVDFFTPIVDDPYSFGAIAAANALSDIYAMGATPLFALNIVGFPTNRLPVQVLQSILKGASDKAAEAGIEILGGHTIEDAEPKFGMVVTGTVHPSRILTNSGARQGDVLVLTKPLGTGIIATAVKRGLADEQTAGQAARIMATLNAPAAKVLKAYQVHACTDITGFGLMGHLRELTRASGVNAEIWAGKVPIIPGTEALVRAGAVPGGTKSNREHVSGNTIWDEGLSDAIQWILCDAQTSGGLLVSLEENQADPFIRELKNDHGIRAVIIGQVTGEGEGNITVRI